MKKTVLLIALIMILVGCQTENTKTRPTRVEDITTFKEEIVEGKVEIDGVNYPVEKLTTTTFIYDDQGRVIEEIHKNDDGVTKTEFQYKDNLLVQKKIYRDNALDTTFDYTYDEEKRLIRTESLRNKTKLVMDYVYGDQVQTAYGYDSKGDLSFTTTAVLNDSNQIIRSTSTQADGTLQDVWTIDYEDGLEVQAIRQTGPSTDTHHYLYNNLGDRIMDYGVTRNGNIQLRVYFYHYTYDDTLLPKTKTTYYAYGPITEEQVRVFQK